MHLVARRINWLVPVVAVVAAAAGSLLASTVPAAAHAGSQDGTRPFVTGLDPAVPGVAATAIFAGGWQVSLSVEDGQGGAQSVAVLDGDGRAFLRIGPGGVEADHGAPAWYLSAVVPRAAGFVRLPEGVGPDSPPDWRPVSRTTSWGWFDPRVRSDPGSVTPEMMRAGVPARLRNFSIPVRVGGRPARVRGYVAFEPPSGRYRHTLLSPKRPAPGVEVDLLAGQVVPTLTVRNESDEAVTVLGADGEPFLRGDEVVEANLASPTWVQTARALGRTPKGLADPGAEPRWEQISAGRLMSWADFRSRPPDDEPRLTGLPSGGAIVVRRWTISMRAGARAVEVQGITEFEPFPAATDDSTTTQLVAVGAVVLVGAAAAMVLPKRGGTRNRRAPGEGPAVP